MSVRQLSIFLENSSGRIAEVTKILAQAEININALVLSDTTDFGVLRLIVNDTEKAYNVLKENQFIVRRSDVVVVPISHDAGSLAKVVGVLADACITIEYMYAFFGKKSGEAFAVFKMEDLDEAKEVLKRNQIQRLGEGEL